MSEINGDEQPRKDREEIGQKWMDRIRAAKSDDDDWRRDAEAAEAVYAQDEKSDHGRVYDFNILHSNVETVAPSLYNSTPVPDIRPVQGEKSTEHFDFLKKSAEVFEACVSAMLDDNALDSEIEDSVISMELAGRGIVRVRFDADVETFEQTGVEEDPETGDLVETVETYEMPTNERVVFESVPWRDYVEGPAKRFDQVPWVAFKLLVMDEDLDQFGEEYAGTTQQGDDDKRDGHTVWEIWCKQSGKVYFVRENDSALLMEQDDPLGLPGFFPIHKPVEPLRVPGTRKPVVPFKIYKTLADELDRTTRRINAITKGIKVRGGVIGDAQNIAALADADDNQLVPIENVEGLAQTGGLDKAIVWWPIEQAVRVVHELYAAREQTKQAIYEITGISDIVRGASRSSETATAQQIKTQWGSLRIQKRQRMIERQVRDLFVMTCEMVVTKFSDQRINELVGYQVEPEVMQFIRGGLKQYAVNVESDSTVRGDINRMKGEMAQFLQGTSQYFQIMAPIVQQVGPEGAAPAIRLYAPFARMFSLGKQAESALDEMIEMAEEAAKAGPQKDPAQEMQAQFAQQKMMLELKGMMQEMQLNQREADRKDFEAKTDAAAKGARAQTEQERTDIDGISKAAEIEMEHEQQRPVRFGD